MRALRILLLAFVVICGGKFIFSSTVYGQNKYVISLRFPPELKNNFIEWIYYILLVIMLCFVPYADCQMLLLLNKIRVDDFL